MLIGAEVVGDVEVRGIVGVYGWSVVIGVYCAWGASSARTKAAGIPLAVAELDTKRPKLLVPAARVE